MSPLFSKRIISATDPTQGDWLESSQVFTFLPQINVFCFSGLQITLFVIFIWKLLKIKLQLQLKKKKCCLTWCTRIRLGLMVNMVIYLFELFIAAALSSTCIRYIRNKVTTHFIKASYHLNYVYVLCMKTVLLNTFVDFSM